MAQVAFNIFPDHFSEVQAGLFLDHKVLLLMQLACSVVHNSHMIIPTRRILINMIIMISNSNNN